MKIKFMIDYGKFRAGDVVDVSEAEAEDHHQAGRAYPFVEEPKPVEAKAKSGKK